MSRGRGLFVTIFQNFIKSLKPKQIKGDFMGQDFKGNKYYEIPADRSVGKSKPVRSFVPCVKDDFESEMPAEWEAWLRGRRDKIPTDLEILQNQAIANTKKTSAARLEQEEPAGKPKPIKEGVTPYPKYDDYELFPGKKPKDSP